MRAPPSLQTAHLPPPAVVPGSTVYGAPLRASAAVGSAPAATAQPSASREEAARRDGPKAKRRARGFTLLELMAVVTIITLLMVIAIPSITHRVREYRSSQAANEIAALYRNARMRAMARGSATVVRWDQTTETFTVLEAVQGTTAVEGCEPLPSAVCPQNEAANAAMVLVNQFVPDTIGDHTISVDGPPPAEGGTATANLSALDVCFSPLGAARMRTSFSAGFTGTLTGVPQVNVSRDDGVGLLRRVLLLPNGASRVTL